MVACSWRTCWNRLHVAATSQAVIASRTPERCNGPGRVPTPHRSTGTNKGQGRESGARGELRAKATDHSTPQAAGPHPFSRAIAQDLGTFSRLRICIHLIAHNSVRSVKHTQLYTCCTKRHPVVLDEGELDGGLQSSSSMLLTTFRNYCQFLSCVFSPLLSAGNLA